MIEFLKRFFDRADILRMITVLTVMGVFFMIAYALVYKTIPENNKEVVIHLLGIIEGAVMTIVGYEFVSAKKENINDQKKDG